MGEVDFFNINPDIKKEPSLEEKFITEREEWNKRVEDMSSKMKSVLKVSELMTEVYTERQICIEYYHYLLSKLIIINKEYRRQYVEKYEYWTYKSNIRYPNETSKNNKIQTQLSDLLEKREILDNHSKFIQGTCSTIDNLIYAIPKRIEIEQITRGK